ncbi:hypothetical protein [Staphylococcus aureus]|uniref:hypothetical protein n=1 Tax=Staphylococcus aureus TaxID=1280 RepID=UPI0020CC6C38|nr:hypothetical protein [Staphylococcus aureus]
MQQNQPFNMTVTITKIQALLRRTYDFTTQVNNLTVDDCELLLDAAKLKFNEETIDLTHTELGSVAKLNL